jgi:tripartite-type tricarboxylate transporter receptor subunit TctC
MDRRTLILGLPFLAVSTMQAPAQSYPSRLVRIVVPFPPGGGIDVLIRAIAQELSTKWSQNVIIENRAGAGGIVGTEAVARSAPDGLTLLATTNQTITSGRFLYKSLSYDPDMLVPIMLIVQSDHLILANPAVQASDLRELVAIVRREPGKWSYGSFGRGTQPHLVFEMLNKTANLDILHVPYNGISPLLLGLVAGDVHLATGSAGVAGELIRTGKVKALAIAGKRRSAQFPDVPTAAELGFPYLEATIWYGLFAPPGTNAEIIDKVSDDIAKVINRADFAQSQILSKGLDKVASSPKELEATIKSETDSVEKIIRAIGIEPQ